MLLKMTQAKAEHLLFQKVVFAERDNEIGGNLQSGLASWKQKKENSIAFKMWKRKWICWG